MNAPTLPASFVMDVTLALHRARQTTGLLNTLGHRCRDGRWQIILGERQQDGGEIQHPVSLSHTPEDHLTAIALIEDFGLPEGAFVKVEDGEAALVWACHPQKGDPYETTLRRVAEAIDLEHKLRGAC